MEGCVIERDLPKGGSVILMSMFGIYVLPSRPGIPPQAILHDYDPENPPQLGDVLEGMLVRWDHNKGMWCVAGSGQMLNPELGECITEHAKDLGVEW